jgi:hypothetical protein
MPPPDHLGLRPVQRVEVAGTPDLDAIPFGSGRGEVVLAVGMHEGVRIRAISQQRVVEVEFGRDATASGNCQTNEH